MANTITIASPQGWSVDLGVAKADDSTIEVTRTATTATVTRYDVAYLKQQREAIQAQKDRDNARRDAELAEVDELLAQADKLGVVEAVPIVPAPPIVREVQ